MQYLGGGGGRRIIAGTLETVGWRLNEQVKVGLKTFWEVDEIGEKGDGLLTIDDDEESFRCDVGGRIRKLRV